MNTDRLKELRDHIASLPKKLWYFKEIIKTVDTCGTVGCALGHCPDIWPDDWVLDISNKYDLSVRVPSIKGRGDNSLLGLLHHACNFFDIDSLTAEKIFLEGTNRHVTQEEFCQRIDKLIA